MNRREFLRVAGVATGCGVAGCLASDRFAGSARPNLDAGAENWATFGADPANTGHAPAASAPTDGAAVVWEFDAGNAAASPVVVGDAVFAGGADGTLYALDAETGDPYWEFDARGRVTRAPAVVGETVYVGTDDGLLHAVDAPTGGERWTTDLGRGLRDSSPTVVDDTVYVGTRNESRTTAADGDRRPGGALVALDAATGGECWSFEATDGVSTTPAVVDGRVYVGTDDGRVRALDAATGERAWSFAAGARVTSSPAVAGGVVYFGGRGLLFALDAETGDPYWTFDLAWPTVTCSPAVADGAVYLGCHGGGECSPAASDDACRRPDSPDSSARLYAVDADYGAEEWTYDAIREVQSSPAVADGAVYVGRADGVSAVAAGDGAEAWRVELGAPVDSSPAVADGRVFVACADGRVCALGE